MIAQIARVVILAANGSNLIIALASCASGTTVPRVCSTMPRTVAHVLAVLAISGYDSEWMVRSYERLRS